MMKIISFERKKHPKLFCFHGKTVGLFYLKMEKSTEKYCSPSTLNQSTMSSVKILNYQVPSSIVKKSNWKSRLNEQSKRPIVQPSQWWPEGKPGRSTRAKSYLTCHCGYLCTSPHASITHPYCQWLTLHSRDQINQYFQNFVHPLPYQIFSELTREKGVDFWQTKRWFCNGKMTVWFRQQQLVAIPCLALSSSLIQCYNHTSIRKNEGSYMEAVPL